MDIPIGANQVTALALIFHEFAINAAKYGALSVPGGRIDIECVDDQGKFHLDWKERGGPDIVQASDASGFGSLLVRATVNTSLEEKLCGTCGAKACTFACNPPRFAGRK